MKNRARIADHPIHPMLITIPIGSFVLSLVFDLIYLGSGNPFWYAMSFWLIVAGIVGGLIAAIPGAVDFLTSMPNEQARRTGLRHGGLNVAVVVLYVVNAFVRATGPIVGGRLGIAVFLSLIGVVALAYSGWLGGSLVYRHRVGVNEPPTDRAVTTEEEGRRAA